MSEKKKVCPKCGEEKDISRFYVLNKPRPKQKNFDGRQTYCKLCANDQVYINKGYTHKNESGQ